MLFTLADLFNKAISNQWQGKINFYPSYKLLNSHFLKAFSSQLSNAIQVDFGERILVTDEVTPQTITTILWLWSQGAVVVPVRHNMNQDAINKIALDCHAKRFIRNGQVTNIPLDYNQSNLEHHSKFECHSQRRLCGADLALIIYTSGSTGKPKGIMLSHANVITAMYSIGNYLELNEQEHILCLSPLSFDYGLYQLLFSLNFDCHLTLFENDFHPIKVLKAIEDNQITLLPVVPAMASALSKMIQVFKKPLPSLIKLTNTGGHLAEDTVKSLTHSLSNLNIYAMYGLTECKRALYLPPKDSIRKLGSVGIPIPGLEAKIFTSKNTSHFKEVDQGEIGELFIRSATLMQGYYGLANAGASILNGHYRDDNWLATGDLFSQDNEGYFYFKGRSKDLIKQAGFCLYPAELEAKIERHSNVHLTAIVPHNDRFGDEIACLYVQLNQNNKMQQDNFKLWLQTTIDTSYCPREIKFIDTMALTENSKVDKQKLMLNLSEA
ncbi:class I adenylate-forming enzyme family protein [Pseudoalteromonas denitrificans]|uniref:Acyl-CoA synthetase (AMP-forming)/AMP-acid ligase II n=1 Tax=Pseudoalteromonas denitrificans DSM 6059 TaxID=1123010 RepID=A0A1I1ICN9_9GAMM|nr:class I adenylate-forming enzyme family protein [Pseudoalteromonas denitrificans]SFC31978.1 Acyl-CoA synthetase (AMP-forming)/AMP-acid ligase II [Pseudoalteromonas denitrificans DSM 6059]